MKKLLCIILFCFTFSVSAFEPTLPEKYRNLKWYAAETENFELYSIEEKDTILLQSKIEGLKKWTVERLGLENIPYHKKCMILCVPTQEMYQDFFHRENAEPRSARSDERDIYAIWIKSNPDDVKWITMELPEKVGKISLMNYEAVNHLKLNAWALVGLPALNVDVHTRRSLLFQGVHRSQLPHLKASEILSLNIKDYEAKNKEDKLQFRMESATLALMLRKELGQQKFVDILLNNQTSMDLRSLDEKFEIYCQNLWRDLNSGKTPDSYLTWTFLRSP